MCFGGFCFLVILSETDKNSWKHVLARCGFLACYCSKGVKNWSKGFPVSFSLGLVGLLNENFMFGSLKVRIRGNFPFYNIKMWLQPFTLKLFQIVKRKVILSFELAFVQYFKFLCYVHVLEVLHSLAVMHYNEKWDNVSRFHWSPCRPLGFLCVVSWRDICQGNGNCGTNDNYIWYHYWLFKWNGYWLFSQLKLLT